MIVYADILLLVNFSMDFLTLYLTGRLLHRPAVRSRLIAAALIGGAGGTIRTIFVSAPTAAGTAVSGFLLSFLMVLTAFGRYGNFISLVRGSLAVWGCGIFVGGIMTFLTSLGDPLSAEKSGSSAFIAVFAVCFAAASAITRIVSAARSGKSASVKVMTGGREYSFRALCDSGSFAADPLTGVPVIIVKSGIFAEAEEAMRGDCASLRVRVIPVSGIGGESVLMGFVPDSVYVNGQAREAVIAVMNDKNGFAGCEGILPAALC